MVRSITIPRVHRMVCNSYNNLDIKYVILQGRAEPKAGLAFDLRNTTALTQSQIWMRYWSLFLLVIPEQNGLTDHKSSGNDEHGCITTPEYQLIYKGQKTTKDGQLQGTYDFLSCGCMVQHVERSSTYFFRITHVERQNWQSHNVESRTYREHSDCDLSISEEHLP